MQTLAERLEQLAATEREIAAGCDMRIEDRQNWQFAVAADEARRRIADLEAAIRMTLRHADANGMQDWPVFRRLRKALNK